MSKKILFILFVSFISVSSLKAEEVSIDEMIEVIIEEQFIKTTKPALRSSFLMMLGSTNIKENTKKEFYNFIDPFLEEYLISSAKKLPVIYKDHYSEKEIIALYKYVSSKEGKSITSKSGKVAEKTQQLIMKDAEKLGIKIGNAIAENPELLKSFIK
tara:strand:- start:322 stop:792 length:471 start_codon:yes stop_codon:yes gene_type:complete